MELPTTARPTTSTGSPIWWGAWKRRPPAERWRTAVQIFLLLALGPPVLGTGCVSRPRYRTTPSSKSSAEKPKTEQQKPSISTRGAYQVGLSSYYAHDFHGKPTASGEIYDMNGLSAAHRELPLGTLIRVTHLGNGRSVDVKVNDRGPFIRGRILDLSLGAARKLDMVQEGVAKIKIEILKSIE